MKVQEIMTKSPVFCMPDVGLQAAAQMMCDNDCGEVPVVESKQTLKPIGVITDRDIACRCVAQGKNPQSLKVSDCMTSPAATVTPDTEVEECCELLEARQIRRLPVIDDKGRLCGIVSQADIARKLGVEKVGEVVHKVSMASV